MGASGAVRSERRRQSQRLQLKPIPGTMATFTILPITPDTMAIPTDTATASGAVRSERRRQSQRLQLKRIPGTMATYTIPPITPDTTAIHTATATWVENEQISLSCSLEPKLGEKIFTNLMIRKKRKYDFVIGR